MSLGRKWFWAGWLVLAALGAGRNWAQGPTTTVQDTITDASGVAAAGTVVVSWAAFTTAAGSSVAAGSLTTTLGAGGALGVGLLPNAGATPMGSYYTAIYHLSDGTTSREFWVVPVTPSGTVKVAAIRNVVLPTSLAMQTVSKQYVDTTVAKAMAGVAPPGNLPYLLKAGDTMLGPLTLPGDPVQATQAADKHYVDAAVAGVAGGGSGTGSPTGAAGGDLSGSYPNPAVAAIHATAGTLDGVPVGATTASTGRFTGVSMADGSVTAPSLHRDLDPANGLFFVGNGVRYAYAGVGYFLFAGQGANVFGLSSMVRVGWSSGDINASSADTCLDRKAANVVQVDACDSATQGEVDVARVVAVSYHETLTTPASSGASCTAGDFTDDANFHYVCVATSTWKRVALSSF